jgi:hypothetical protein
MPRQNRVTPLSDLIATPARGLVYGNRGCLHDDAGRIRRHHNGKRWIACRLRFKDWHRAPLMQPGRFTELFFLDEATAFAAGHRPCALCRRADYDRFMRLWQDVHPHVKAQADPLDAHLHDERIDGRTRTQRHHGARIEGLPDGTFVVHSGEPHLVRSQQLHRWSPAGYIDAVPRPRNQAARVITPPSMVAILAAGWAPAVPLLHPSVGDAHARERRSGAARGPAD